MKNISMGFGTFTLTILGETTRVIEITHHELQAIDLLPSDMAMKLLCNRLVLFDQKRRLILGPFYIPSNGDSIQITDDNDLIDRRKKQLAAHRVVVNKYGEDLSVAEDEKLRAVLLAKGFKLWGLHLEEAYKIIKET